MCCLYICIYIVGVPFLRGHIYTHIRTYVLHTCFVMHHSLGRGGSTVGHAAAVAATVAQREAEMMGIFCRLPMYGGYGDRNSPVVL